MSIPRLIVAVPLITSAFVDIPARVQLGPVSGLGVWTSVLAVLAIGGLVLCGEYRKRLLVRVLPYLGFLVWMVLSLALSPPDLAGIQNGILYVLFGSLVVIAGTISAKNPLGAQRLLGRTIRWIDWVSLGIVLASLVLGGLPTQPGTWWFAPRGLALLGVIPLSWHLAGWYYGARGSLLPACLWLVAIALSLSRMATAISLVLLGTIAFFHLRFRLRRAAWSMAFLLVSLTTVGGLITYSSAFRERLFAGDAALAVGVIKINTEGRLAIWARVIESAKESPVIGKGLGSSQAVFDADRRFAGIGHPHNDYLRLGHDLGGVGLFLFLVAAGEWLAVLLRGWNRSEHEGTDSGQLDLAGALGLIGVLLAMLTDNVIIYVFVMAPLGVLVGVGLGLRPTAADSALPRRHHVAARELSEATPGPR